MLVMDATQRVEIDLRKLAEKTATKLDDIAVPMIERVLEAAMPLAYDVGIAPDTDGIATARAKLTVSIED